MAGKPANIFHFIQLYMKGTKPGMKGTQEEQVYHLGKNVQRLREFLGFKQATLAELTGKNQQFISRTEQRVYIPDELLEKFAGVLEIPVDLIKNLDERAVLNRQHNIHFHGNSNRSPDSPPDITEQHYLNALISFFERQRVHQQQKLMSLQHIIRELTDLRKQLLSKNSTMSISESLSPNETIIHWGYCIKKVREAQGISIEELARRTTLRETQVYELESRQHIPGDILQRMADAMGVAVKLISAFSTLGTEKGNQYNSGGTNYQLSNVNVHIPDIVMEIIDKYIAGKPGPEQPGEGDSPR